MQVEKELQVGSRQGIAGGWFAGKFSRVFSEASDLSGIASDLGKQPSYFNSVRQIELQQSLRHATNRTQSNYSPAGEFKVISPLLRTRIKKWYECPC